MADPCRIRAGEITDRGDVHALEFAGQAQADAPRLRYVDPVEHIGLMGSDRIPVTDAPPWREPWRWSGGCSILEEFDLDTGRFLTATPNITAELPWARGMEI